MTKHVLTHFDTADFGAWRSVFETEKKAMTHSGLKTLNVWQDNDNSNHAWILFEVLDESKAEAWMAGDAVCGAEREGVANERHIYLQSA
ncbi:MAG: hypothetical protein ACPGNV_00725 [Mangrovicoccus sp.]